MTENPATKTADLTASHTLGLKITYATNNGAGENMTQRMLIAAIQ